MTAFFKGVLKKKTINNITQGIPIKTYAGYSNSMENLGCKYPSTANNIVAMLKANPIDKIPAVENQAEFSDSLRFLQKN